MNAAEILASWERVKPMLMDARKRDALKYGKKTRGSGSMSPRALWMAMIYVQAGGLMTSTDLQRKMDITATHAIGMLRFFVSEGLAIIAGKYPTKGRPLFIYHATPKLAEALNPAATTEAAS